MLNIGGEVIIAWLYPYTHTLKIKHVIKRLVNVGLKSNGDTPRDTQMVNGVVQVSVTCCVT